MLNQSYEEVVAVNIEKEIAVTNKDVVIQITDYMDQFGERCQSDLAVVAIGFDSKDRWWSINLVAFSAIETN